MTKSKPEREKNDLKIPISEAKKPEKELKTPISEPKSAENAFKFTFKLCTLSAFDMKDRISVAEWNDLHITASPDGMKWVNMTHDLYEYSVGANDTVKINALQEAYRQLPEHPYQYPPYVLYKEWADKDGSAGRKDPKPDMTHEVWLGAGKKEFKTPFVFSMGFLQGMSFISVAVYPGKDAYICYDHMNECWTFICYDHMNECWTSTFYNGKRIPEKSKVYKEWVKLMESGVLPEIPSDYPYIGLYKAFIRREALPKGGSWHDVRKHAEATEPDFYKGYPDGSKAIDDPERYEAFALENLPPLLNEGFSGAGSEKEEGTIIPEAIDPGRRDVSMKSILLSRIGSRICEQRKKKGMTQEGLANALGTTQAVISRMENGSHDMSTADLYGISMYFNEPLQYLTDEFPAPVGENVWIMDKEKKFFHKYRIIGCSPDDTAFRSLFVVPVIITPYLVFESWGEETRSEVKLDYSNISCIPLSGLSMSKSNPGDYVLNIETETPVSIHTIGSCDPSLS